MHRTMLVASLLAFCWSSGSDAPAAPPTFDAVVQGLDRAEAEIRNFEVHYDLKIRMETKPVRDGYVDLTAKVHALVERSGRFHFSETGTGFNYSKPDTTYPSRATGAYDGATLKQMVGGQDYGQGLISKSIYDAQWRLDSRRFLFQFTGTTVGAWLRDHQGRVTGTETIDGDPAVVLETEPVIRDEIVWKVRFVVAPTKNHAVLRRALLKRYVNDERWFEYSHVITSHYKSFGPGISLPGRALYESFNIPKAAALAGAKEFPISWRYDVTLSNWKVNRPVADADFQLEFEPGLFINDKIRGTSFTFKP